MHTATIALGANLPSLAGEPAATLAAAATRIASLGRILARSTLYSTAPVGLVDQPRFVNAVVTLETNLNPQDLLRALLAIEQEFGRDRSAGIANGPRTLDLDILLYDDLTIEAPELQIPHPRLPERAFVLVPLAEMAPAALDPRSGKTAAELLEALRADAPEEFSTIHRYDHRDW
jgi:2-amino-4-hydroxy-6-hydroxymethyldihydropteridine diphosphokinase